jgi:hypothetical protein
VTSVSLLDALDASSDILNCILTSVTFISLDIKLVNFQLKSNINKKTTLHRKTSPKKVFVLFYEILIFNYVTCAHSRRQMCPGHCTRTARGCLVLRLTDTQEMQMLPDRYSGKCWECRFPPPPKELRNFSNPTGGMAVCMCSVCVFSVST